MKLILMTILLVFTACSSFIPKADTAKVKKVESLVAKRAFKQQKKLGASKKWLRRLRAGQWVATVNRDKKSGEVSLVIRKVVKATKKSVVMEMETYSTSNENPTMPNVVQQIIKHYPLTFKLDGGKSFASIFSKVEFSGMKIKRGNKPVEDMGSIGAAPVASLGIKGLLSSMKFDKAIKSRCMTKYLSSSRCYKLPYSMGVMGFNVKGIIWQNSNVPIVGFIRSESDQFVEDVIAFGFRGAKPIIK